MKLSIIIPVYKTEKTLSRCLDSIANQKIYDYEIIIIVDDSPEFTRDRFSEYIDYFDDKLKIIIHEKNRGLLEARKTGIKKSCGEYILHIDSDDWLVDGSLSNILSILKSCEIDVLELNYSKAKDHKSKMYEIPSEYTTNGRKNVSLKKVLLLEVLSNSINHCIWNKIIKRDLYIEAFNLIPRNKHINVAEDLIIISSIFVREIVYQYYDYIFYYYYQNKESLTGRCFDKESLIYRMNEDFFSLNFIEELLIKNNYDITYINALEKRVLRTIIKHAIKLKSDEQIEIFRLLEAKSDFFNEVNSSINSNVLYKETAFQNIILKQLLSYCRDYRYFKRMKRIILPNNIGSSNAKNRCLDNSYSL